MSYPGQVIAIGSLSLSSLSGVTATVGSDSDDPTLSAEYVQRADAGPVYLASSVAPLQLTITIGNITTYSQRRTILRALRYPQTDQLITVRAYVGDPSSVTEATLNCTIASIAPEAGSIVVVVNAPGGLWTAATETTLGPYTFSDDGGFAVTSSGEAVTYATYKVGWTTQRTTQDDTVGWKYRRQVTVTNNTTRDWKNRPHCIELGDTEAWVSGSKALTSGDDVIPVINGKQYHRSLVNFNSKLTFLWFLLDLPAGESVTVDIIYGNPAASSDNTPNLHTRTGSETSYIAFNTQGYKGTATGGTGSAQLDDSGATWEGGEWAGGWIKLTGGTGAGQARRIAYNGTNYVTASRNFSTAPDATTTYVIWKSGVAMDGGRVTARTANTMTDSSNAWWGANIWEGATVTFLSPSGATPSTMTVASNDSSGGLVFTGSFSVQPAVNDSYVIQRYGVHSYNVVTGVYDQQYQRGLWRQNKYYGKPSRIWYGNQTPGGWMPTLYLDNGDDFAQSRTIDLGSGGGHSENWWPILRARRSRSQDNTYPEEGQADGVSIYAPEGYQAIFYAYKIKNESGVGKFVISVLEPGGEDWRDVVTNSTTYASLTSVSNAWRDLSTDDNPTRIYMGVLPADGVAIPSSVAITEEIEVRNEDWLQLYLDITDLGGMTNSRWVVGSEASVYDLQARLRFRGGDEVSIAGRYDKLIIGGRNHYLFLESDELLWITTDPAENRPFAAVYDSSDDYQYTAAWAVRPYHYEPNDAGVPTPGVARQIMPIAPVTDLITNGSFTGNITSWTTSSPVGTANWSYDSGTYFDTAGSAKVALSTGTDTGRIISTAFTTVIGQTYTITLAVKTDGVSVDEVTYVGIVPYVVDDGGAGSASPLITGIGYILNTTDIGGTTDWQTYAWEFTATDDSYVFRVDVKNLIGSACNVWLDQITGGVPGLYVTETAMGKITVKMTYSDRYLV